jgi:hypothetical protein
MFPRRHHASLCALLFVALLLRGLLPAGVMPDAQQVMVLCTPSGMQTLVFNASTGELETRDGHEVEPCEYAPLLAQAALPVAPVVGALPQATQHWLAVVDARDTHGASAPPRARGPPHFI